jgi:predicted phage-related endonuclease
MSLTAVQVENRKRGVGGSELLAALGKDSRCSRLELYKRKVGELPDPDFSDNERVRFGNLLEPVIRQEVGRRLKTQILIPEHTLFHPDAPLLGHPDGWFPAWNEGLEIKTCDKYEADEFGEEESDQVPIRYLVQCSAYMALTGAAKWRLAVLIGGNELRLYEIPRDEQLESALIAGATEFWKHVEARRPPDPGTPDEVRMRWPKSIGTPIHATPEIVEVCGQLGVAKAALKTATEREENLKSEIEKFMTVNSELIGPDGSLLATWRTPKPSMKFDLEGFAKDHPGVHAKYLREVPNARRFLLKKGTQSK